MSSESNMEWSGKMPYSGPRHTVNHPELGNLTGRRITSRHFSSDPVVQFRSVPYATVPQRFSPAQLLNDIPENFDSRPRRDFTTFGAACPQTGAVHPSWCDPYGGPLDDDLGIRFDDLTCLTVSISVPVSHVSSQSSTKGGLPVMVYIHGGGMQDGVGHVDGLHSNAHLAAYAASISQPVIIINVGYRLNWFGSLVCNDVLDEYQASDPAARSATGPFNLTLQDQRLAFLWIQKFIGGFGGDANNITAFGESGGSMALLYHICGSSIRLFDRVVLQSGTLLGHTSFEDKEEEYQAILNHFEINAETPGERLSALRQVDPMTLAQCPALHVAPYIGPVPGVDTKDSLFTRGLPTVTSQMNLAASCDWLGDVVVGDVFWEGQLCFHLLKDCPQARFIDTVKNLFPGKQAEDLLTAYEIPSTEAIEHNRAWMQMSLLLGDAAFSADVHRLSRVLASTGKKRKVYRYHLALSNPFPGSVHSFTPGHHFVEILFLFLTLLDRYPTHRDHWLKRQACETARRWIMFANGQAPWDAYEVKGAGFEGERGAKIAICDDNVGWTVRTVEEDEEISKGDAWGPRRYAGWRAFDTAYDAIRANVHDEEAYSDEVTRVKMSLLQLAYGPLLKVPGPPALE